MSKTKDFFARVLADKPNHVLTLTRGTVRDGKKIFWNKNYPTLDALASAALAADAEGLTVYHALGSFSNNEAPNDRGAIKVSRKAIMATAFKSLACDIDVGEGKPYLTQIAAAQALAAACAALKLPSPMVVSSGYGLHCYWPLQEEILRPEWALLSVALRDKLASAKLELDTTKVCDPAMVLRPVGTSNRKDSEYPLTVRMLRDCPDYAASALRAVLGTPTASLAAPKPVGAPRRSAALDAVLADQDLPLADAHQIAMKCPQIGAVAATRGDVAEPIWYLALGVANHCVDGAAVAIRWSDGHPKFTREETERKFQQWGANTTGPATCAGFEKANPDGCKACVYRGKVGTPIQLSIPEPEPVADLGIAKMPAGYQMNNGRVLRVVDGVATPVCNYPLLIKARYFDAQQGKAIALLEARMKAEGVKLVEMPIDTLAAGKDKWTAFLFNHSIAPGPFEKHIQGTRLYLMTYLEELQSQAKPTGTYSRFGWTDDGTGFVLGARRYHKEGAEDVELSPAITTDMRGAYESKGDLAAWVDAVSHFGLPGMEYYAMCMLIGMGAPLLAFTDLDGFVISMYSPESGTGKTTTGHMINSIWGNPKTIQIGRNDTMNAMYHTLVQQHNLPAYFEEITNIGGPELSDFVYNVAHGRERRRMTEKATLREGGRWKLPVFTSTNRSLIGKLQNNKLSSEGELQRIIEYPFYPNGVFDGKASGTPTGLKIAGVLRENHGLAGPKLLEVLCKVPDLQALVANSYAAFQSEFKFEFNAKERYAQAAHIIAYLAGRIGTRLGIVPFDYRKAIAKSLLHVEVARKEAKESHTNAFDVIGMFTNEHTSSTVYERTNTARRETGPTHGELRTGMEIRARFEVVHNGAGRLEGGQFYADRAYFNRWCQERGVDASDVLGQLRHEGITVKSARIALGRRTSFVTTAVWCHQIDLLHPEFVSRLSGVDATRESMVMVTPGTKAA